MVEQRDGMGGKERRRHERVHKMIDLRYGACDDFSEVAPNRQGTLLDIGGSGLRFMAEEAVEIATQLLLILEFPGWRDDQEEWVPSGDHSEIGVLRVMGTVVRCQASSLEPGKYEIAVCFCGRVKK
jgi:hypothetical protein